MAEVNSLIEQGGINLPDADSCEEDLGTDPDPYAKWQCMVAQDVANNPDGPWAKKLEEANADIEAQDFHAESIGWFAATRQIKTFHPRTPGMLAYRDSIIDAINEVNANVNTNESPEGDESLSSSDPVCHSAEDFPDTGAVDPGTVHSLSEEVCDTFGDKLIQFDDDPDKWYQEREAGGVLYQYGVSWVEGCNSTRNKIPGTTDYDGYPTRQSLFDTAFDDCNNGGIGGYVDLKCARFTFTGGASADDSE